MIDTIVLRFHGTLDKKTDTLTEIQSKNEQTTVYAVDEHHELYKKMLRYDGKFVNMVQRVNKEITTITAETDSEFLYNENAQKDVGFNYVKQVMRFADERKVKEIIANTNGKMHSPSSIAAVVFKINHNAGFIDFNLSIPKYLYGHSLAEFIPQPLSKTYLKYGGLNLELIKNQRKIIYKRLMKFIDKFLLDIANMFELDVIPNKDYIEIRRIDLCYNQYFESKGDALNYLNHQKKIAKKKATLSNNQFTPRATSIEYFTSSGAYFKIYHKGTEYVESEHGDYKKHKDYNNKYFEHYTKHKNIPEHLIPDKATLNLFLKLDDDKIKGKPIYVDDKIKDEINQAAKVFKKLAPFKTDFLKKEMDKVLRYEISLKGSFFSYQYKMHVFRNKPHKRIESTGRFRQHDSCPIFKELKENYKYVHSVYHSDKREDSEVKKYQHKNYNMLHEFFNRKICLTISNNSVFEWIIKSTAYAEKELKEKKAVKMLPYKYTLLSKKDVGLFCDDFLQRGFDYFFETVKGFQLKKLETYDTVSERIKQHNEKVKENLKMYNKLHHLKTKDKYGQPIIKGNLVITKASQLLTQKEKREKKLKRIDPLRLLQILREMEKGVSLHQIRDSLQISKSTFSRLKTDLEMFGVFEQSLEMEKPIFTELSFRLCYHNLRGGIYRNNFYHKEQHMRYG